MKVQITKLVFLVLLLWVMGLPLHAFIVSPTCPDFTDINASYVVANTGTTSDPFTNTGVVAGRHTLINIPGTDPRTGNLLQLIPPGETQIIKLGNEEIGGEAEALSYHFKVDELNSVLQIRFAVVFEDPQHPITEQPRFKVRVTDKNGALLKGCSEYDVTSSEDLKGFHTYNTSQYSTIRWKDWTSMVLDLSSYAGEEIQVQFVTYDCGYFGHFGYAYFTAHCLSNQLSFSGCTGSQFTAEAPVGFNSYLWDNGDTSLTSTRNIAAEDMTLSCRVVSDLGCSYVINGYVSRTLPVTVSSTINDTICEGEPYLDNYFQIPPIKEIGDFTFYNTFFNPTSCSDDITTTLHIHVIPRIKYIKASICTGQGYTQNGFNIQNPPLGLQHDTLTISGSGTCDIITYLELTVNPSFGMSNIIQGDTKVCTGDEVTYTLITTESSLNYAWELPADVNLLGGEKTKSISIAFTQPGSKKIKLTGQNGCGVGTAELDVNVGERKSYFFRDTICSGEVYKNNGFLLPKQDSIGQFVHIEKYQSFTGCDSTRVLSLVVNPSTNLNIMLDGDSILCSDDAIKLSAITQNTKFNEPEPPPVRIGDILCMDGTIFKPENYPGSLCTPQAIVGYVDSTGLHGWAVALQDIEGGLWANPQNNDVKTLTNNTYEINAIKELNGYLNTQKIRAQAGASTFPAAWAVDFANGWYMPTYGQLRIVISNEYLITNSFLMIGGDPTLDETYWTSTEFDAYQVWIMTGRRGQWLGKTSGIKIRQFRNF